MWRRQQQQQCCRSHCVFLSLVEHTCSLVSFTAVAGCPSTPRFSCWSCCTARHYVCHQQSSQQWVRQAAGETNLAGNSVALRMLRSTAAVQCNDFKFVQLHACDARVWCSGSHSGPLQRYSCPPPLHPPLPQTPSPVLCLSGVGPIMNLQSNDAAKLWSLPSYIHMIWNGPFQVGYCASLCRMLTWHSKVGSAVICRDPTL